RGNKWVNHDVEVETSSGIVPFKYRRKSYVHATMWSIGLELSLLVDDPWKIYLTTDHPNGAPFTTYPKIISWLMSEKAREKALKKINSKARAKSLLPSIDREYSFYEIAIVTRAGQAKALGLKNKGHLGAGADADIAIYNIDPREINPSKGYKAVRRGFSRAAYTIKSGEIVARDGEIVKVPDGKIYWVNPELPLLQNGSSSSHSNIPPDLRRKFREYWTVEFDNYFIPERYLRISAPIRIEVRW
ncbi:amidohydrolase family protein, partial [Candidatus Bathyarchaeota archaeon]|nr:amidohydrolase family protein [Candidatus Bathyarchaeota archaeon]